MRSTVIALLACAWMSLPAAAQTPITETANVAVGQTDAMASNLVGLSISNAEKENVGKIQDLVLDSTMKVTGVVMSVGGFLGVGSRYVIVQPDQVKVIFDTSASAWKGSTSLNRDQIKGLPEFKYEGKFAD